MDKTFNLILRGVGGQGIITLLSIINEAAFIEGYDVKSSELHGLSQRGGSVETHIRFGEKVYSPLVSRGQADLIIGLEVLEGLRGFSQANSKTKFLINNYYLPFSGSLKKEEILGKLKMISKSNLYLISASEICKKELNNEVVSGIYLLGYAVNKKLIPLKTTSILGAIKKVIPEKYLELNKKAFGLAHD
ncbi:indolepyruvate oxidoreductase subunit beta [Patescibacteria group bacterium]|nr:indolepyruvate oxidoreductase subunit beta [Patescibacteria group bacterium]